MAGITNNDKLLNYLDQALRGTTQNDIDTVTKVVSKIFGDTGTRELYDRMAGNFNPLKDINMYSYMPMKATKKVHGKTIDLTPQEMIQRTNTSINLRNIIGDIIKGVGTASAIKNQAISRVFQNEAAHRSNRERELFGSNYIDRAAEVASPTAEALGGIIAAIANIGSDRIYGNEALRRQAEMQAVMDAYNRNVGGTGLFYDARRKSGEGLFAPSTTGK